MRVGFPRESGQTALEDVEQTSSSIYSRPCGLPDALPRFQHIPSRPNNARASPRKHEQWAFRFGSLLADVHRLNDLHRHHFSLLSAGCVPLDPQLIPKISTIEIRMPIAMSSHSIPSVPSSLFSRASARSAPLTRLSVHPNTVLSRHQPACSSRQFT